MVNYRVNQGHDSLSKIIQTVAAETGISEKTIYSVRKENSSALGLQPAKRRSKNKLTSLSRDKTYDESTKSSIRGIVHDFFRKNTPPTINSLLAVVNKDEHLPNFSRTTLHRLIKDMGFVYTKRDRKSMLIEKPEIISWRHRYLREIRTFREQNYNIVYLDESWVNIGHSVNYEWRDTSVSSHRDAFVRGLTTGLKPPTARGPRFVLLHAGGKDGFINGAELTFLAKKNTADYHDEMTSFRKLV
uniref:Uncharacterized protein LOC114344874 n=1 Tax=Diabrotica virgifera virgifera TaxID=50390 RepID=A0A6P7GNL9_DIAVI